VEFLNPAGFAPPLHRHLVEDELIYVLSGTADFHCDGEVLSAGPGDFVLLPVGLAHSFIVGPDGPLRALTITSSWPPCGPKPPSRRRAFTEGLSRLGMPQAAGLSAVGVAPAERRRLQRHNGVWAPTYMEDGGGRVDESLADKTVLIVGYGSVGAAIEQRLAGFEVEVLRVARTAREGVAGLEDLPKLLPLADVVMLVVPATAQTRGLVDAEFLGRMKDGALLVNVARGIVVDTGALLAETSSGRLRAALDVTDPEPLPADHPLWKLPNVLITPHVGGGSTAFLLRALKLIREQLRRYAAGEPLLNQITSE
jgi:hypothetical protein